MINQWGTPKDIGQAVIIWRPGTCPSQLAPRFGSMAACTITVTDERVDDRPETRSGKRIRLILGFGVLDLASGDQGADQRAEKSLASFARVMDELEEPEVDREFLLRNAAMRPQPGAK